MKLNRPSDCIKTDYSVNGYRLYVAEYLLKHNYECDLANWLHNHWDDANKVLDDVNKNVFLYQ